MQISQSSYDTLSSYLQKTNQELYAKLQENRDVIVKKDSDTEEDTKTKRETYGTSLLEMMDEESYDAFSRATKDMSDAEKKQYATSLELFSYNYISATTGLGGQSATLSLANIGEGDEDISSLIGSSFMLKASSFGMNEGQEMLKKMGDVNGESMFDFIGRFKNALLSKQGINISG